MAARKRKLKIDDNWRAKIKLSNIVTALAKHVDGIQEMKGTQIRAAEILLKKTIPDLMRTEHVGDADQPVVTETRVTTPEEGRRAWAARTKRKP